MLPDPSPTVTVDRLLLRPLRAADEIAAREADAELHREGFDFLTAATPGSFLTESLDGRTVPVSETTFSWWNITAAVVTVLVVALALFLVAPRAGDRIVELEIDARDRPPLVEHERGHGGQ